MLNTRHCLQLQRNVCTENANGAFSVEDSTAHFLQQVRNRKCYTFPQITYDNKQCISWKESCLVAGVLVTIDLLWITVSNVGISWYIDLRLIQSDLLITNIPKITSYLNFYQMSSHSGMDILKYLGVSGLSSVQKYWWKVQKLQESLNSSLCYMITFIQKAFNFKNWTSSYSHKHFKLWDA